MAKKDTRVVQKDGAGMGKLLEGIARTYVQNKSDRSHTNKAHDNRTKDISARTNWEREEFGKRMPCFEDPVKVAEQKLNVKHQAERV